MHMMTITEARKVTPATIANCFNHGAFITPVKAEDDADDPIPLSVRTGC